MPITVAVDPARGRATLTTVGCPSYEEACDALDRVIDHPHFRRGFGILNDRRHAEDSPDYQADASLALADRAGRLFPCRWAVVVTGPVDTFGLWLASAMTSPDGMTLAAFESVNDAEAWLESRDSPDDARCVRAALRSAN